MTYLRDQQVVAWHRHKIGGVSGSCTITVSDYANIADGTTLTFTKSDGTTVTFTSTTGTAGTDEFRTQTNNNTTADNIYTAINAHADFTVANPAAAVVTVEETTRAGAGPLTVTSSDTTRLTTTDQAIAVVESLAIIPSSTTGEEEVWMIVQRTINGTTRRYVEYLSDQFDIEESQAKGDAFLSIVDSHIQARRLRASVAWITRKVKLSASWVTVRSIPSAMYLRVLSLPLIRRLRRHRLDSPNNAP